MYDRLCQPGELGALLSSSILRELGAPTFWMSKCKIRIKTLGPLESPHLKLLKVINSMTLTFR